jgi:hypothetical protein
MEILANCSHAGKEQKEQLFFWCAAHRWTFQGLARNELEGVNFYPPGCIASGMPGATQDEVQQACSASLYFFLLLSSTLCRHGACADSAGSDKHGNKVHITSSCCGTCTGTAGAFRRTPSSL